MDRFCKRISVITFIVLSLNLTVLGNEPEWFAKLKEIKVLQSTRQEVENLFNSPRIKQVRNSKGSQTVDYEFEGGRFEVSYSTGKCSLETNRKGYNIDKDIVTGIYLFLFEPIKISKLKLDLQNFEKHKESDTNSWTYYDEDNGVEYIGDKKTISSIHIYPNEKYDHLYCKNVLKIKD